MKIKIIRNTIAQKRQVVPGDVLDVSKEEAIQLIGANKAIALKESAVETAEAPQAEAEEAVEPAAEEAPKRKPKKASE